MNIKRDLGPCYCGGMIPGASYADCCQPCIEGTAIASTAEHLMRSRYTAYAIGNADYLLSTWHISTRPTDLALEAPGTPHAVKWLRLAVHSSVRPSDTQARVLFTAKYREGGRAHSLKEHSNFVLEGGRWFYVAGDVDFEVPDYSPTTKTVS